MTKEEFAKELFALMLSKGKEPSKAMATVWYEELKCLPDDKVKAAFQKLRRSSGGFPNVGEIFEMISPPMNKDAEAEKAWADAVNGCGYSRNPYIASVVSQIGGPDTIGYADNTFELPRVKKQFLAMYKDMMAKTPDYIALPVPKPEVKKALTNTIPSTPAVKLSCTPEQAEKNRERVREILSTIGEKRI